MAGRFVPPRPELGDPNTLGGYRAVHDRPVAFEGTDGLSYSVEIVAARTGDSEQPWGAYLLFVRWHRTGEQGPSGHLETDFLSRGSRDSEVIADVARLPLANVKSLLDACIVAERGGAPSRRWWDVMRDESDPGGHPAGGE
jgi:hypothetical protein